MGYQHILVPIDGSPTSISAIEQAANLAITYHSQVTVLYVLTIDPFINIEYISSPNSTQDDVLNQTRNIIKIIVEEAEQKFLSYGLEVDTLIIEGQEVHKEITRVAQEQYIDLIVIGSHGRTGVRKLVLGSVTQKLLGETHLPVLVIRGE